MDTAARAFLASLPLFTLDPKPLRPVTEYDSSGPTSRGEDWTRGESLKILRGCTSPFNAKFWTQVLDILLRPLVGDVIRACRIASATIVSVGFSAARVVNWLPSDTNKFAIA